jgi:hypothetical protein
MSYKPELTSEARAVWRRLEVSLQEEILDAVDQLAANPDLLRRSKASPEWVYDFTCETRTGRHYFFLTIQLSRTGQKLIVLKLGHSSRKI